MALFCHVSTSVLTRGAALHVFTTRGAVLLRSVEIEQTEGGADERGLGAGEAEQSEADVSVGRLGELPPQDF